MDKAIVSKTFSAQKYKDADLAVKAAAVLEKMTNNVYFSDIQSKLDELKAKIKSYDAALADTGLGGKLSTAIKRECRRNLEICLQEVATYVQLTSKGDDVVISSSGFDMHRKAAKVGMLDQPENVRIIPGNMNGSVWLSCNVVSKALFYVFAYCEAPATSDSVWIQITNSRRKIMIDGLTSGKEYCFKVAAARTHPSRVWSDVVSSYVI
ncbi:MAG: fibronectin type III domain-containing protein [Bacteroidales bacterium]|nr:fibronectin type III domain-containing protein [Bacteroidales bacterium]